MPQSADYLLFCVAALAAFVGLHFWARRGGRASGLPWLIWGTLLLVLVTGYFSTVTALDRERRRMEAMVGGFAPTYAGEFSRMGHARITLDTPPDDPLYLELIEAQKRWVRFNPAVADIYTFRRLGDGTIVLLVDSETDYDRDNKFVGEREGRTAIGEVYVIDSPALAAAFAGVPRFDDDIYTDRWGTWVSAYHPMYDVAGRVEGVLGVDYDAGRWLAAIRRGGASVIAYTAALVAMLGGSAAVIVVLRADLAVRRRAEEMLVLAKEESDAAAQARTEFVANVSHEIRTPMTAILGYADLLLAPDAAAGPSHAECVQIIRRNGEHLLGIINDILDIAKVESGRVKVRLADCSPAAILDEVRSLMLVRALPKGIELRVEHAYPLPLSFRTDPLRLKQILVNLVGNAIKFTDRGSVTLRAALETDPGGRAVVRFDIVDTGIGITPAQLGQLFTPFYQADESARRRYGGTGLGLSISRRLAEMLGGGIDVASVPGSGSTFTLRVDAGPAAALTLVHSDAPAPALVATPAPLSPPHPPPALDARILLADDGADNRRLFRFILERAGATVELAEDGRVAAAAALAAYHAGTPFDLVLMDMQMPELDGYAATRRLRAEGYPGVIVALTALTSAADLAECLAAGCDGTLTKPLDRRALVDRCARWIGGGHSAASAVPTSGYRAA